MTIVPRAALFPLFIILILDSFSSVDHRLSLTLFVQQISPNIDQHSEFFPLRPHSSSFSCLCLNRSKYKSSHSHCVIIVPFNVTEEQSMLMLRHGTDDGKIDVTDSETICFAGCARHLYLKSPITSDFSDDTNRIESALLKTDFAVQ
jgi:hypothetical protein